MLYSPSVANRLRQALDERRITVPSGYPFSNGLTHYLQRNDSVLTLDTWNKAQSTFALVMSFAGMVIVVLRWFRGSAVPAPCNDAELHGYLSEVAACERGLLRMQGSGPPNRERLVVLQDRLAQRNIDLVARYPSLTLENPRLFDLTLDCLRTTRARLERLADNVTHGTTTDGPGRSA